MEQIMPGRSDLMEVPLQDLLNELLLLIWGFLEPKEMNALILTCRQFRDTFNNLLYQHPVQNCPVLAAAWMGEKG
ncbi:hypothetical protein BDW75DRAFT_225089 [Aspergillus navahoensis]